MAGPVFSTHEDDSAINKMISFRNYKGFKQIDKIKEFYKLGDELGSGSFGSVFLAVNKLTDKDVAIKVIKKKKIKEAKVYYELLQNELLVLEKTDHPHITRVFEILENNKNYFVVMELVRGGNLLEKIIKAQRFTEDHVCMIVH